MRLRRRVRRIAGPAAALVLAAGIVALAGSPASAHANLLATSPSNGAELNAPPDEIRLRFSERVTVAPEGVQLRDTNGGVVATEPPHTAAEDPAAVVLPVPADLPEGGYVVTFRAISADSHPVSGAITFGVGVASEELTDADVATDDPIVAAVFAGGRWISYAGLALLAGALSVFVLCWPGGWRNRRARRLVTVGWIASLAGAVAVLLLQGPYSAGRSLAGTADPELLSATLDTDYGRFVLARLGLVVIAGGLLLGGARLAPGGRPAGALAVGVGLPATWIGTGHANTADHPFDVVAEVVHLVAMSTWFGGLALLGVCLLPRSAGLGADEVAGAVRRFSLLATAAVVTLVGTGIYIAWQRVGALDALFGTPYGRLLALKLATMAVLLWLGAMSRSVVQHRYASRPADAGERAETAQVSAPAGTTDPDRTTDPDQVPVAAGTRPEAAAGRGSRGGRTVPALRAGRGPRKTRTVAALPTGRGPRKPRAMAAPRTGSRSQRRAARAAQEQERAARTQLHRSVRLETGTALAVLAVASVLVATPPGFVVSAAEALEASPPGPVVDGAALTEVSDDGGVQILVDPAWVGENRVVVEVVRTVRTQSGTGQPAPATAGPGGDTPGVDYFNEPWDVPEVRASFALPANDLGPLPVELTEVTPGVYEATGVQLPAGGEWRLEVTVRTTDIDSMTVPITVPVT